LTLRSSLREQILANQTRPRVIPPGTQLTPWPDSLPKWETLNADEKKMFIRQADVLAAYVAYTDNEIGRVSQHKGGNCTPLNSLRHG
jgi:arylsulfatase A-like enzyme